MINILSIRCAFAFAPYLAESHEQFIREGAATSRVVRQGGTGLIIRSDGGLLLRHQNREATLSSEDARHYLATVRFRIDSFQIERMQDEVVMADFQRDLVLSFPQSEMWLDAGHISEMIRVYRGDDAGNSPVSLPDWLNVSASAESLLISDQRNGRWVLLGADHMAALGRRLASLIESSEPTRRLVPPAIPLKGINVRLQSAFRVAETLKRFASAGEVGEFEDAAPHFTLAVRRSTEGVELRDSERRVALTKREAAKWADIIRAELERLNAAQVERGSIRTVFADADAGRWILQWGDEVFVPGESLSQIRSSRRELRDERTSALCVKQTDEFLLLLSESTGACVALAESDLTSF